jgi:hypothetical protein
MKSAPRPRTTRTIGRTMYSQFSRRKRPMLGSPV